MWYLIAILVPPIAVIWAGKGFLGVILNIILCFLGGIPGLIHAIIVVKRKYAKLQSDERNDDELQEYEDAIKEMEMAAAREAPEDEGEVNEIIEEDANETTIQEDPLNVLEKNKTFFLENNLIVLKNGNLRDENYEEYELEEESDDFIVYKPEGMRGKRAYIKTDGENYLAWSGPISIKDKSKFLRGDFGNFKVEPQNLEEVNVQEDEVENIEEKKEIKQETNDEDLTLQLQKLTKLYEEGILTEDEYKNKTSALIDKI